MKPASLLLFTATIQYQNGSCSSGVIAVGRTEEEAREGVCRSPSDKITLYPARKDPGYWQYVVRPGIIHRIKALKYHKHFAEIQKLETEAVAAWEAAGVRLRELFADSEV